MAAEQDLRLNILNTLLTTPHTVAVAAETLVRFVLDGTREDWTVTLRDLAIRPLER